MPKLIFEEIMWRVFAKTYRKLVSENVIYNLINDNIIL
jgi:hypothetical protein